MADQEKPYFKFVSSLIESGIWASMSPAARTLYPVLLKFSDRNFKPVYPGSQTLLKLTGFKQKSSIRKARRELVDLGLISITEGTGRKNTCYHFRFDWGDTLPTPRGSSRHPDGGERALPGGLRDTPLRGHEEPPEYNKIHISINNNLTDGAEGPKKQTGQDTRRQDFLIKRFGKRNVDLAVSECELAGLQPTPENLEKLLYSGERQEYADWKAMENYLEDKISPGSLAMIRNALLEEGNGMIVFSDRVPQYLRTILTQLNQNVFFEPTNAGLPNTRHFWKDTGAELL